MSENVEELLENEDWYFRDYATNSAITFKVGDWVVHQYGFIDKIEHIREGGYILSFYEGDSIMPCLFSGSELELWQPKQGEWVIPKTKTKESFNVFKYSKEYRGFELEPFLGELPSFLK